MALATFSEVTRFYGRQDVLKGVTLSINAGEKIGLVGRNGAGKTTVIRLLMEEESPDDGLVTRARGLRLGYLPQNIMTRGGLTLLNLVLDTARDIREVEEELAEVDRALNELSRAGGGREELMELAERQGHLMHRYDTMGGWEREAGAKKVLSGLGFAERDFDRDLSEFSGGWVMRGVLARLLLAEPDLLILDEPTNHLDLDSLIWLENYLKSSPSALLLVSHDRVFLNNVAAKIIEVRQGRAHTYIGGYNHFLEEKAQRLETEAAAFENQRERIKQIEKFIEKNRVRASTARRAQSRLKMLEKMDRLDAPENLEDQSFNFHLPPAPRGPEQVAELAGVAKRYGQLTVYEDLNLNLRRGQRLALIGPNGRGKSTLLKMLAGIEWPTQGQRRLGQGVVTGYFAQFQMDGLSPDHTILEELATVAGPLGPGALRSVLGAFLFSGEDVFKKVAVLSGGEKARLALAKIMITAPNLLLLDEPTNHLDIPGRQMLEEALAGYGGTMVLISHDRHFINSLCRQIGVIENGRLVVHPGNYDDYQEYWLKKDQERDRPGRPAAEEIQEKKRPGERRKREAEERRLEAARRKPFKDRIAAAEARLAEMNLRKEELTKLLANPRTYQDPVLSRELNLELQALTLETGAKEAEWEEAMAALEALDREP